MARGLSGSVGCRPLSDPPRAGKIPDARLRDPGCRHRRAGDCRPGGSTGPISGGAHSVRNAALAWHVPVVPVPNGAGPVHPDQDRERRAESIFAGLHPPVLPGALRDRRHPDRLPMSPRILRRRGWAADWRSADPSIATGGATDAGRWRLRRWNGGLTVHTRQQGTVLFTGILVLIGTLVIIQLWLLTAALEALLARSYEVLVPASIASGVLFVFNALLLRYVVTFDDRVRREERIRQR